MSAPDPLLGSPAKNAWMQYSVKGSLLSARPRYVRERWGDGARRDVAGSLDPQIRATFQSDILPFTWYPFRTLALIDCAIARGPMGGDASQMQRFGDAIARYDLSTLYKMLFKLGTPTFLIKRVNIIYQTYVRGGTMSATDVSATAATVTLTEGSLPLYFCRYGVSGWFTAALELSGGRDVKVKETSCVHDGQQHCRWQATWT